MNKKPVPAIDLLLPSIEIIRQNVSTYFLLSVIPMLLLTYGTMTATTLAELAASPFVIAGWMLSLLFLAPLTYVLTKAGAGKKVMLPEAFRMGYRFLPRLIGLGLIVGALIILGFICFIVPGFILLKRYYLAPYLLIDKNLGITEAMRRSAALAAPHTWAIYGVIGVSLLFGLFGIVPVIGNIFGVIMQFLYSVAPPLRYFELKNLKS